MTNDKKDSSILLGFLAVSPTVAQRMAAFPVTPGFDKSVAEADLQTKLAEGDWKGFALALDPKGKLRIRGVPAKP